MNKQKIFYPATAVTSVALDKTTLALTIGDAGQLTATVAPEDATDKAVTWSSDKTSVATVDATGKVTAVAAGEATITATAGDKTAICKVTVVKKAGAISYTTTSINKTFGEANFTNELTKTGDGTVTYTSSDTSVASVSNVSPNNGLVTILGTGIVTITATVTDGENYTYAKKTAEYTLTVKPTSGIQNYNNGDTQTW